MLTIRAIAAVACSFLCALSAVMAQDTPVDLVRKYGPDTGTVPESQIAEAVKMLQWQNRLVERQVAYIRDMQKNWQDEVSEIETGLAALNSELESSGLSISVNNDSLADLLSQRFASQIEGEALAAKAQAIEQMLVNVQAESKARNDNAGAVEEVHLAEMLQVLAQEREQLAALQKSGSVSQSEVRNAELKISEAKLNLDRARQRHSQPDPRVIDLENQLAEVTAALQSRKQALAGLERSLDGAQSTVGKAGKMKRRLEFVQTLNDKCNAEVVAIQLKHSESAALLQLCEEALKEAKN